MAFLNVGAQARKASELAAQDPFLGNIPKIPQASPDQKAIEERREFEQRVKEIQASNIRMAADTHSAANNNETFVDGLLEDVADIPKFIAAGIISGGNQLYNIAPSIGNAFGGDFDVSKTSDVIRSFDDDLANYYEEHKQGVDTLGFILGSLVPGMAGIKVLNAGQKAMRTAMETGNIGKVTGAAFKLLTPSRQQHLDKAVEMVRTSNIRFSLGEGNLKKAIASGVHASVLEAAAFETAVAATMFNSPVLEEQDLGDLMHNIAFGGVVFGAIGGTIDAARSVYTVKNAVKQVDKENLIWTAKESAPEGASASDALLFYSDRKSVIPVVPEGLPEARAGFLKAEKEKTEEFYQNKMRESFNKLTGQDMKVARLEAALANQADSQALLGEYLGAKSISRLATVSAEERKWFAMKKLLSTDKGRSQVDLNDLAEHLNTKVVIRKNYGEGAGKSVDEMPVPTQIADTLKSGQEIVIGKNSVTAGKTRWDFDSIHPTEADMWDVLKSDVMETNARRIWMQKQPPLSPGKQIHSNDVPMMEKAYREFDELADGDELFKFIEPNGDKLVFFNSIELLDHIASTKRRLAGEIQQSSIGGVRYSSAEAMTSKLRELTGLHFAPVDESVIGSRTIGDYITLDTGTPRIRMNKKYLAQLPVHELLDTIKHEQGHSIFDVLLSIGGIPASIKNTLVAEMETVSRLQRPEHWKVADKTGDYGYLRFSNRGSSFAAGAQHELAADTFAYLSKFPKEAKKIAPNFERQFGHLLHPLGEDVVKQYIKKAHIATDEEIASILNVRPSYLTTEARADRMDDLFAMESYSKEISAKLRAGGELPENAPDVNAWELPQHSKMLIDTTPVKDMDGMVLEGIAVIKQRQNEYVAAVNRAVASVIGKDEAKLPDISARDLETINRLGAERGFIASASANYGTLAAKAAWIGNVTSRLKHRKAQEVDDIMQPVLYKLTQDPEAAIEWSTLNAEIRSRPEAYTLNEAGDALVLAELKKYNEMVEEAIELGEDTSKIQRPEFDASAVEEFPIRTQNARDLAALHIEQNAKYRKDIATVRAAQGVPHSTRPDVFYPIPINQKDFPFFATVTDDNIVGHGHTKTLYANTEEELTAMIRKLDDVPGLKIRTKKEAEEYFKLRGQFEYEKTINENRFDSLMHRKGISAPYFVSTDPQKIANELMAWHKERGVGTVMEAVSAKYEIPFAQLRNMGEAYTNPATSKTGSQSIIKNADDVVNNPYMDLVKTSLDIKNHTDYPFWIQANRLLDSKITQMFTNITRTAETSKSADDLAAINKELKANGYKGAAYDMEMELLANHTAPRGALTAFIQQSNALLATTTLRLDFLNAVNNAVGANVLLGAETKAVIRAINRGDDAAVGELADLTKIVVPGTDKTMFSFKKLYANAIAKFGRDTPEMQFYKDHNYVTNISEQYRWTLDQLTLEGKETVKDLSSKIERVRSNLVKAGETGERWTGNRLAEEFNRFIAADIMKQMTDVAVKRGLMEEKTALAYINTFVNRTQGNYLASQRPMMFQGPIGQSIGLFQTYQFNLMQQLLRHVGEGKKKDWATMLGLQGTIYGMNGLPAFNAINNHIIGNASGNTEHRDAYTTLYGSVGKQAADWIMYGAASNMLLDPDLKVNLYTRGDINPRHVTIVPTNPADIPIVGAYRKFFGNLFSTTSQAMSGNADLSTTFLQGLEHNGISRPLAGLAQTLEGLNNPSRSSFSTTKQGNVIAANDLMSLTNMARLVGGKPMAEAITVDAAFRIKGYAAKDMDRRKKLSKAIKTTLIAGGTPTQEQVDGFAEAYVSTGGKQTEFNKWMLQLYKRANLSQANELKDKLNTPHSIAMQELMGGQSLQDFSNRDVLTSRPERLREIGLQSIGGEVEGTE